MKLSSHFLPFPALFCFRVANPKFLQLFFIYFLLKFLLNFLSLFIFFFPFSSIIFHLLLRLQFTLLSFLSTFAYTSVSFFSCSCSFSLSSYSSIFGGFYGTTAPKSSDVVYICMFGMQTPGFM